MSKKKLNRYEFVHEVAKLARRKEMEERDLIESKKSSLFATINESKKRRNYVLEAFEELNAPKDDGQC